METKTIRGNEKYNKITKIKVHIYFPVIDSFSLLAWQTLIYITFKLRN